MPFVQATEKEALKQAIVDAFLEQGVPTMSEGSPQLDAITDAVTKWMALVLPKLVVTVVSVSGVTTGTGVSGSGTGTIS